MHTATFKSSNDPVSFDGSITKIDHWHKQITMILIFGVAISVIVFANFFFISPPHNTNNTIEHLRSSMDSFLIGCLFVLGAVYFGLRGREIQPSEEGSKNMILINQQKRMAGFSLGLFLVSGVIILFLSSPLWH